MNDIYRFKYIVFSFFFFLFAKFFPSHAAGSDINFDIIIERLSSEINERPDSTTIVTLMQSCSEDGTWNDIDYNSTVAVGWPSKYHLYRLVTLCSAFSDDKGAFYGNLSLLNKIIASLSAWLEKKPRSDNWWPETIFVPQKLGAALILLKASHGIIPEFVNSQVLEIMHKAANSPYDFRDANRFDVALHWLYRACLESKEDVMTVAVNCIYELLDIGETGFQVDSSFFHDGPQFFIGGYCVNSVAGVVGISNALRMTPYELNESRKVMLRNYFLNTWLSAARGGAY